MPASTSLQLHCPAGFDSVEAFREQVEAALAVLEAQAAEKLAAEGRSFLGAWRVLAQRPTGRPATGEFRRGLNPRVASRDKWKRIEALTRLKEFVADYREALAAWRLGIRDVIFPAGTYQMRLLHAVRCAAPA